MCRWWSKAVSLGSWCWKSVPFPPWEGVADSFTQVQRWLIGIALVQSRNCPITHQASRDCGFVRWGKRTFCSHIYMKIRVTERGLHWSRAEAMTVTNDDIAIFVYNPEYYLYPTYPQFQMHTSEYIKPNYATTFFSDMLSKVCISLCSNF